MDLNGRHVVITGAAGGIGAALATRFHADGAQVVIADRSGDGASQVAARLDALRPGSAIAVTTDVSTEAGNIALIAAAEHAFGPIDLFFANAGVGLGADLDASEDDWNASFDINVHAHRWAARHLVPGWVARGEGYFCSTASAAGLLAQIGSAPYSVTKHAAVALAEWISITYGDRGVRVSCLCPQGVNTAMLTGGDLTGSNPASDVVRSAGRVLEPAEVADVVAAAIAEERFLILPHAEVADYELRKTTDRDRWIAGMRRLQARMAPGH